VFKTTIRFKTSDDDKIIRSKDSPEITCEQGFIRFWFQNPEEMILVNSEVILTVSSSEIEELQIPAGVPIVPQKKETLPEEDLKDLFPNANDN
jgi:hypothetical protein